MIDYTTCSRYPSPVYLLPEQYSLALSQNVDTSQIQPPAFHYENASNFQNPKWQNPNNITVQQCTIDFTVPVDMTPPVYMYYRLTNFYQNHRQYISSYDENQLAGQAGPPSGDCGSLARNDQGTPIFPCGMIANSMFNGIYT